MAIWQFNLYFIPKLILLEKHGEVPAQLYIDKGGDSDKEDALSVSWWQGLHITYSELMPLLSPFGEAQFLTIGAKGFRSFGHPEKSDIALSYDEETGIVQELSCRLDLRENDNDILQGIFKVAAQYNCVLMDEEGRIFEPNEHALVAAIQQSPAHRFVINPRAFFEHIQNIKNAGQD